MGPLSNFALSGAGAGLESLGVQRAEKERRAILNRALERSSATQDNATQQVLNEGANYGQKRLDDVAAQEQTAMAQALKDIGAQDSTGAGASVINSAGDAGAVSGDFLKAKADRAISEGNRLTAVARELAKVRAPGQQMTAEGLRRANLTSELGSAASSNRNMVQAAGMDAENVDMPWWGKAGGLIKNVGNMYAMTSGAPGGSAPRIRFGG